MKAQIHAYWNYWYIQKAPDLEHKNLLLEAGINAATPIATPDGSRTPVIALRSSPWKAGQDTNPWHDEFDLDAHVRYYGDHKPCTLGPVGVTRGNRWLMGAWQLHDSGTARIGGRPRPSFCSAPRSSDPSGSRAAAPAGSA